MNRTVKYTNEFAHGPEGTEFLVPYGEAHAGKSFLHFANKSADQILASLQESWESSDPVTKEIADTLSKFSPRSMYQLERPSDAIWLLLQQQRFMLFIGDQCDELRIRLPTDIEPMMQKFAGYQFGFASRPGEDFLMPSSGFFNAAALKLIDESDESYLWEDDESVLGGVYFYSTDCGNQFCCRSDGSIAKWNMGSATIEDAFPTCIDFAREFKTYFTVDNVNRDSSLCG